MNPILYKSIVSRQFDLVSITKFEDVSPNHESRFKEFSYIRNFREVFLFSSILGFSWSFSSLVEVDTIFSSSSQVFLLKRKKQFFLFFIIIFLIWICHLSPIYEKKKYEYPNLNLKIKTQYFKKINNF